MAADGHLKTVIFTFSSKAMTHRQQINQKLRFWGVVPFCLAVAMAAVLIIAQSLRLPDALDTVLVVVVVLAMLALLALVIPRLLCPSCGESLHPVLGYGWLPFFRLPEKVRFCPLCGFDLDTEIPVDTREPAARKRLK